ncbi:MAG: hypothetical protein HQL69_13590 [Magnetococcales bacterium]|nr:hypothetical protein [Magnetococcales bacterium]
MDTPRGTEPVKNKTIPHASVPDDEVIYPSKEIQKELKESILQARNGDFADDKDVKAFFDKWGVHEG